MANSITDIPGVKVGQSGDAKLGSGTTAVVFEAHVAGGVRALSAGRGAFGGTAAEAVRRARGSPRDIDILLVNAQQARRVF